MLTASANDRARRAFIGMSSGSGRSTGARKAAYSASKFAVEAYVKCLAHSLNDTPVVAVPLARIVLVVRRTDILEVGLGLGIGIVEAAASGRERARRLGREDAIGSETS